MMKIWKKKKKLKYSFNHVHYACLYVLTLLKITLNLFSYYDIFTIFIWSNVHPAAVGAMVLEKVGQRMEGNIDHMFPGYSPCWEYQIHKQCLITYLAYINSHLRNSSVFAEHYSVILEHPFKFKIFLNFQ